MTPTSATGSRSARAGLTLVELMIVMVILGLASAAVVMTLPDHRPALSHEAEVFAARLVRAREEAILTSRTLEVTADEQGYAFRVRRRGERVALDAAPFEPVVWADGSTVQADALFVFDPTGGAEPAELALTRERQHALVSVNAAGEVAVHAG